jgi:hypothetical protein
MTALHRWQGALRVEDGVLAAWLGFLEPLGAAAGGSSLAEGPLAGAVMVGATLMAIVCLATRPPDQPGVHLTDDERVAPRWILAGPLVGGTAIISATGFEQLGIRDVDLSGIVLLVAVGAIALNRFLPVLPALTRRLLVLPFMVVAGSLFNVLTAGILGTLDPAGMVASIGTPMWGFTAFILLMVGGSLAAFYAMLIVAPRQLADPEDGGFRWVIRFVLFLVASLTGIGWLTVMAG